MSSLSQSSGTESSEFVEAPQENCIYVVVDWEGELTIKRVGVYKESAKALFLGDSIMLPNNPYPKRLLLKTVDTFARSKEQAVAQYIAHLSKTLDELEQTKIRTLAQLQKVSELPLTET